MEDWGARLKTLTDDELILLHELIRTELGCRHDQSREWKRCQVCNGTGKHPGGYCRCAVGRDIRVVELGTTSSYELPGRWDDV
jgi:hypothetical protein